MRLKTAIELSDHQLSEIKDRISQGEGHDHALILEAHRLMVHDPMFVDEVKKLISRDRINAEWAVRRVARKIKHMFDNIPDDYFRERRTNPPFAPQYSGRQNAGPGGGVRGCGAPPSIGGGADIAPGVGGGAEGDS